MHGRTSATTATARRRPGRRAGGVAQEVVPLEDMRVDDLTSLMVPGSDHRALVVTVQVAP